MSAPPHVVQIVESLDMGGLERVAIDLAVSQPRDGRISLLYLPPSSSPGSWRPRRGPQAFRGSLPQAARKPPPAGAFMARQLRRDTRRRIGPHPQTWGIHVYATAAARSGGSPGCRQYPATAPPTPSGSPTGRTISAGHAIHRCRRVRLRRLPPVLLQHGHISPAKAHVIINAIRTGPFLKCPPARASPSPALPLWSRGEDGSGQGTRPFFSRAFAQLSKAPADVELRIVGGRPR